MASRIRILSEQLANMIAAGEVVERPVSVVKELVENSIDAGARRIGVEIEGGGKRLVRVTDDGCGMGEEDLLLAVERHATSKISSPDDLFSLSTMGFRGEALPSIASVSRLALRSRLADAVAGKELLLEGGVVRHLREHGMPVGTVVEVRDLFFNTPARLKFLKSAETEAGHVADLVGRISLAHPGIRFTLTVDGRKTVSALDPTLEGRAHEVLGRGMASQLSPFRLETERVAIHGLLAPPTVNRSNPGQILAYVNGRFVRDRVIQHAVLAPYRTTMEKGRYPVVIVFIDLPPHEVDVNVHPTKHEVRFREQGKIHDLISEAISSGLAPLAAIGIRSTDRIVTFHPSPAVRTPRPAGLFLSEFAATYAVTGETTLAPPLVPAGDEGEVTIVSPPLPETSLPASRPLLPDLEIIGQFLGMFILCREGEDLLIVDQHAAHERVRFERLRRELAAGGVERQGLLFPRTMELGHRQSATLMERYDLLESLGFSLCHFGGTGWAITHVPRLLEGVDPEAVVRDVLDELESVGKSSRADEATDHLLMTIACHSAVRGAQQLTHEEIGSLLRSLSETERSGHCPHGRPVLVRLGRREIEKLFGR